MEIRFKRGVLRILLGTLFPLSVSFAQTADPALSPTNIFAPVSTPANSIFELSLFVLAVAGGHIRQSFSPCWSTRS